LFVFPVPDARAVETDSDARAQILSALGSVQYQRARQPAWSPARAFQDLFLQDTVRTAEQSRAAVLFFDETQVRLGPSSELTVSEPDAESGSVLNLLEGEGWFRTKRSDSRLRVRTQAATAAVRGTEFALAIGDDAAATVTVIEGAVRFFNEAGSVTVNAGEEGFARPGEAPTTRTVLSPRDAAQWIIYYPFVPSYVDYPTDRMPTAAQQALKMLSQDRAERAVDLVEGREDPWSRIVRALSQIQLGDLPGAREALGQPAESGRDSSSTAIAHRGLLELVAGAPEAARAEFSDALSEDPRNLWALCYAAFLELYQNHLDAASDLAGRAVAAHQNSFLANVTAGEVAQASYELDKADAFYRSALRADPQSARALLNRARIAFGRGRLEAARGLVERAAETNPNDPSLLSMRGFILLSQGKNQDARAAFRKAVDIEHELGEAYLGLGIEAFQSSDREDGLFHMLSATLLQPRVSLYQSYLAKAYYDLQRTDEAFEVIETAKALDPLDPTPWLYQSIFLRSEYRWADSLAALNGAIARNDNRGVYRSRALLDRDEATKNLNQAQIYTHFGFTEWGRHAARSSLRNDFANAGAHLLLSSVYLEDPDLTIAGISELLQYLLLAPVNRNTFASFKEYAVLFERPGVSFKPDIAAGYPARVEAEYYSSGGNDRITHQLLGLYRAEDGARPDKLDIFPYAFASVKVALGRNGDILTRAQAYYIDEGGDEDEQVSFGADTDDAVTLMRITDEPDENSESRGVGLRGDLGFRYAFGPLSPLLGYVAYDYQGSTSSDPDLTTWDPQYLMDYELGFSQNTLQGGLQQVLAPAASHRLIVGSTVRYLDSLWSEDKALYEAGAPNTTLASSSSSRSSQAAGITGYLYYALPLGHEITLTPGLRAQLDVVEDVFEDRVDEYATIDPALGLSVRLGPVTTLRAAAFKRLQESRLAFDLAPTAIEGFLFDQNQADRFTDRWEFDVALDQEWRRVYLENAATARFIEYPRGALSQLENATEYTGESALNWLASDNIGIALNNTARYFTTAPFVLVDDQLAGTLTLSFPAGVRLELGNTYVYQTFPETVHDGLETGSAYLLDAALELEPGTHMTLSLTGTNLLASPIDIYLLGLPGSNYYPYRRVEVRVEVMW